MISPSRIKEKFYQISGGLDNNFSLWVKDVERNTILRAENTKPFMDPTLF